MAPQDRWPSIHRVRRCAKPWPSSPAWAASSKPASSPRSGSRSSASIRGRCSDDAAGAVYLPPSMPLNLYDFACWARGTIAPLTIVISRRPVRPTRRWALGGRASPVPSIVCATSPAVAAFWWLDKLPKCMRSAPLRPRRETHARHRVARWIVDHQEADGSWGGIQPPWVYSLIALNLKAWNLDHPVMRKGLDWHRALFGARRARLAILRVHVARVGHGMGGASATRWQVWAQTHPRWRRAVDWLLAEQIAIAKAIGRAVQGRAVR